jgi:trigger factor
MNIDQESTGELTAKLRVSIGPDDYSPAWNKALEDQRKQANLPGFRPGKVPMSIVKKRIGRSLLLQEVEKLLGEGMQDHITKNNIRVIGQPIPAKDDLDDQNWDKPDRFNFEYELGLAPEFDVDFKKKVKVTYNLIKVNDELIDKEVEQMRRRFGKLQDTNVSGEKDLLLGDLVELDENGNILEAGKMARATVSLEYLKDKATQKKLMGVKIGDEIKVDPHKISSGHDDLARMLNISHDEVHDLKSDFLFRVSEVKTMILAELNEELFKRLYGEGEVSDEKGMREKIKQQLSSHYATDSDRLYVRNVLNYFVDKLKLKLPDAFIKRWIKATSQEPVEDSKLEADYPDYSKGLKEQLVSDRIVEKFGLEAKFDEIRQSAVDQLSRQYAMYGMPLPEGPDLEGMLNRFLSDREELRRLRDQIVEQKLVNHFKEMLSPKEKTISYDDFVKLAQNS